MEKREYLFWLIFTLILCGISVSGAPAVMAVEFPDDIIIHDQTIQGDQHQRFIATDTITAGPAITIQNDARVTLGAGRKITIQPGFKVVRAKFGMFINKDIDADGLFDWWETGTFKNLSQNAGEDYDGDGLSNLQEFEQDLNPVRYNTDNDGDGLTDAWELLHFGTLAENAEGDFDRDQMSNILEFLAGTNPNNPAATPEDGLRYGYDELGRLTRVFELTNGQVGLSIQYLYDDVGNITRKVIGGTNP